MQHGQNPAGSGGLRLTNGPGTNLTMEEPGQRLKKRRELLNLRYRDVEEASQAIAERRGNDDFAIVISRLSEFENRNAVPSLYKLYSLCAIYRLDFFEVLEWYGIDLSLLPADSTVVSPSRTHTLDFSADVNGTTSIPLALDPGLDLRKTTFLSRMIQRWGRIPLLLMSAADPKTFRYAYVGTDDWSMYPVLQPGSLLLIDESKRRIASNGWTTEEDRPIYLLEHRDGYFLGWCTQTDRHIIVQPHPSSETPARVFSYPEEVDVLGQVVGFAMRIEPRRPKKVKT